jgi:hypothetical protein
MLGHSVLGCKHYFSSTILLPFSSYTRDCSKRLAILHRLKLEFLPIACKIITTMIMLLVVLSTSHKPALAYTYTLLWTLTTFLVLVQQDNSPVNRDVFLYFEVTPRITVVYSEPPQIGRQSHTSHLGWPFSRSKHHCCSHYIRQDHFDLLPVSYSRQGREG